MLNRRNSMSLHQPIMPFKWRPFDLYNDIHVNCATGDNSNGVPVSAASTTSTTATTAECSNCVRCQSNCDHLVLWGNFRKQRQSSRGSSSGSSCASLSTTSHFVPNVDSASSMSTIKSSGSFQYYHHKLLAPNNESNRDKFRCAAHQQQQERQHRTGCNGANVNCCCSSNCRNVTRSRASIYNNDMICRSQNSVLKVPLKRTESMRKLREMHASPNECNENSSKLISLKSIVSCKSRTNESNSGCFDNWQLTDNDASISNRSLADKSARRYVESDVNIHYKTPVRYEIKDPISDAELIHRQEQAKKLYQEERRRKYLQELQDLNNRRHTDNFTPSQKSPISLHRYDDFGTIYDYVTKSSNYPKTVARALYNFQGQTSRELSFKKGDIIHIRREIDNNWYEGEINATIGLLPANYVEIISKDGVRLPTKKPTEGQARAKFNFQAQSAIELSLHKGELVVLTRRVDDNWFEGRVANQKGIFPVSYVEVLTDIGSDALPVVPSKPVGAPASHSLITSPNYQLSPRSNYSTDFTTTTNIISNGNHSPVVRETSKTLQKTEVLHVDTTNSEPVPYRAIYKYRPQNSDELELQEGDTVYVLEKCDDGWFVGTSQRTGFFGTFPGNYVEKLLL
ncbi:uncharacterized protein LOC129577481 isoform X29 [Sitodiplosis mosellana]|uniref:uncharacterized protein LOC129577481 isoform X29 n=1 Tax=Sitodiplosis mosellana TaxID=263140 RepID=UPI0024452658|nr:uncharacterized protein LOC129577481 isoform X29 [Sitodiplosis mosellana]